MLGLFFASGLTVLTESGLHALRSHRRSVDYPAQSKAMHFRIWLRDIRIWTGITRCARKKIQQAENEFAASCGSREVAQVDKVFMASTGSGARI